VVSAVAIGPLSNKFSPWIKLRSSYATGHGWANINMWESPM